MSDNKEESVYYGDCSFRPIHKSWMKRCHDASNAVMFRSYLSLAQLFPKASATRKLRVCQDISAVYRLRQVNVHLPVNSY